MLRVAVPLCCQQAAAARRAPMARRDRTVAMRTRAHAGVQGRCAAGASSLHWYTAALTLEPDHPRPRSRSQSRSPSPSPGPEPLTLAGYVGPFGAALFELEQVVMADAVEAVEV